MPTEAEKTQTIEDLEGIYDRAVREGDENLADLTLILIEEKQKELCS